MRLVAPLAHLGVLALSACSSSTGTELSHPPGPQPNVPRQVVPSEDGPIDVPQGAFTGDGEGCSNLLAFRASADETQFAVVQIDRAQLGLSVGQTKTVDLGTTPAGVEVYVDVYAAAIAGTKPYCSAGDGARPAMTRWMAEAGTLTITLGPDPEAGNSTYRATLRLEKVHLVGPDRGFAVVVPSVHMESIRVGWPPG